MPTFDTIEDMGTGLAAPGNEISSWTIDDIRKSDILVFRESHTQHVDSVIAPNGLQVGLLDEAFLTDLLVTGHITGSGIIYSELGFSGSLQTLCDGANYLQGAGGIVITNNDDGSITIDGGSAGGDQGRNKSVWNLAVLASSPYEVPGLYFSGYGYSPHSIDVFHNGELLTSGAIGNQTEDFYLGEDTETGGIIYFNFDTTASDDITVIVGSGGGAGGGSGAVAGTGLTADGSLFNVNTDDSTITVDGNDDLTVLKVPNNISPGLGLQGTSFDGSTNSSFSLKTVAGSPVVVSGAGVDFSMTSVAAVSLDVTDEVLVQQGNSLGKVTVSDIITAAGGNPGIPDAAYLVAQNSNALTNERVLQGGAGIQVSDNAQASSFSVSVLLENNGGLEIVNGSIAVKVGDFAGFGLQDINGVLSVNPADFAGTGLTTDGNQLAVNFGSGPNQVVAGDNTLEIVPGDGLNLGGTVQLGEEDSVINLAVQSTDIKGRGLSVSNNNLDVYLAGANGIDILSGSSGELIIDASTAISEASLNNIIGGAGITSTFDAQNNEYTISLDYLDQNNVFENAPDGTLVTLDEENDRILVYDSDTQEVVQIKPSQIAGSGGGQPVVATQGIISTDTGSQFDLEIDYDDTDNVVTSAHDPIQDWEIDEENDKILVYDNDEEQVIKISPSQFSGGAGKIGDAEDGTYDDGLFTDFDADTPTGTAIDRFNEILKALAPAPAPDLFEIDENVQNGITALLSFGSSNATAYENVAALDGTPSKDVNDSYNVTTDNSNLIRGIYSTAAVIGGDLNESIPENLTQPTGLTNYSANAFSGGDTGTLVLEINGIDVHTLDLTDVTVGTGEPGNGSAQYLTDGSGFTNVSEAGSGQFDSGAAFDTFKHRTGKYRVDPFHQQDGWNYVKVKHVKTPSDIKVTNHVQWVVDSNAEDVVVNNEACSFSGAGSFFLSGVEYFTGGQVNYQAEIENYYKFVYSLNNITFNTSGNGILSNLSYAHPLEPVTQINIGNAETHEKVIVIDSTEPVSANYILGGSLSTSINLSHPTKNNLSSDGSVVVSEILVYSETPNSSETLENFVDEDYRMQTSAYDGQGDIVGGAWDPQEHMLAGSYNNSLQLFQNRLQSPLNTYNSGDFSSLLNGPVGNPDYSAVSGELTYYRKFQNLGAPVYDFSWTASGNTDLDDENETLDNGTAHISFKLPDNGTDNSGWMDAASPFLYNSTSDGDGGSIGVYQSSTGNENHFSFGTGSIGTDDYIIMKITADESWTGYIDQFELDFGATSAVNPSADLETLNINESADSTDAKLSFGDTLVLNTYSTVENTGGNAALNANDECVNTSNRLGTIGPVLSSITGTLNIGKAANGNNFPNNSFGGTSGNLGLLKLYVNDEITPVHSEDLSSFGSGNSLSNGSGFNLSDATVGRDSNNLPNYNFFWRTGTYTIAEGHQRNGWNWARVDHEIDGATHDTNYVEWINDPENPTLIPSNESITDVQDTDISVLSGVQYFESPSGKFRFTMDNAYKYVYSSSASAVRINTATGVSITSIEVDNSFNVENGISTSRLPSLDINTPNAYDASIDVVADWNYSAGTSIPGNSITTITIGGFVDHPLVGSQNTASISKTNWLVKTVNDSSTLVNENFSGEQYRLIDTVINAQGDIAAASWDSNISLAGADAGHNTGLIVYNDRLMYPAIAGLPADPGDFRDASENGSLSAPLGNPDYSAIANERIYYRKFQNNTGSSHSNMTINIQGSGTIGTGNSPSGNEIKVYVKLPITNVNYETGFLDISKAFATNQYSDGDGALLGTLDATLPSDVKTTLGVNSVQDTEWIIIKIVAASTWSGYVSNVSVSWG